MKHFIYTCAEHRSPNDGSGTPRTVTLYQIVRGVPKLIATEKDTFRGDGQMAVELMEKHGCLPKRAFARHDNGARKLAYPYQFEDAGLCTLHNVGNFNLTSR